MIIPINDTIRISSDASNWIVQVRQPSGWCAAKYYSLGSAGGLRNALKTCATKSLHDEPLPHPVDLEPLTKVVERLEMVEQRIRDEYATPRQQTELAEMNIAVEAAGYRFDFSDPCCIHRQVSSGNGNWSSKNFFNSLGDALISTLHRIVRSGKGESKHEALRAIHETEMTLRTVLNQLPAAYFSAESGANPQTAPGAAAKPGVTLRVQPHSAPVTLEGEPA